MSRGVIKTWDLDVERMSRDDLEANYFDAVAIIEDFNGAKKMDETRALAIYLKSNGVSSSGMCARFLLPLIEGKSLSHEALAMRTSPKGLDSHFEGGQFKIVNVAACHIRKFFRRVDGLELTTVWGFGYEMPPASIAKLKQLIAEHQSNQRGK